MVDFAAQAHAAAATRRRVLEAARPGSAVAPVAVARVVEVVGISSRTASDHVRHLVAEGHLGRAGAKGGVWLTAAGRRFLDGGTDAVQDATDDGAPLVLRRVLDAMPCEEYRAFTRLAVGTIIARHHLLDRTDEGWASFWALGGTNLGKTGVLARGILTALGLELVEHRVLLAGRTKGQIIGRSVQSKDVGWTFEPAHALSRPVAVLDEAHEADGEPAQAVRDLCHGASTIEGEHGERVAVRPVPIVLANREDGADLLASGYGGSGLVPIALNLARRGVVLDVRPLRGILPRVGEAAATIERLGRTCRPVPLDRLRPAVDELPDDARAVIAALSQVLTPAGRDLLDVRALQLTALGVSALMPARLDPATRAAAAAAVVALDYLEVTATLAGMLAPGWAEMSEPIRAWLAAQLDEGDDVAAPTLDLTPATTATSQDAAREAEETQLLMQYHAARESILSRVTDALNRLPKVTADLRRRVSPDDVVRVEESRAALSTLRTRLTRQDGAGGVRVASGVAGAQAAVERVRAVEEVALTALDVAGAVLRDLAETVNGPAVRSAGSPTSTTGRRPGPRQPRAGEVPIAGLTVVPSSDVVRGRRSLRPRRKAR